MQHIFCQCKRSHSSGPVNYCFFSASWPATHLFLGILVHVLQTTPAKHALKCPKRAPQARIIHKPYLLQGVFGAVVSTKNQQHIGKSMLEIHRQFTYIDNWMCKFLLSSSGWWSDGGCQLLTGRCCGGSGRHERQARGPRHPPYRPLSLRMGNSSKKPTREKGCQPITTNQSERRRRELLGQTHR